MSPFATSRTFIAALSAILLAVLAMGSSPALGQDGPTVSIEGQRADAGTSPNVPVQVQDFEDVESFQFEIQFDESSLSVPEAEELIENAERDFIVAGPSDRGDGELFVAFYQGPDSPPISVSDGTLFEINFSEFTGGRGDIEFNVSNSEVNGGIGTTFQDGFVSNQGGSVSLGDVQDAELNQAVQVPLSGGDEIGDVEVGQFEFAVEYDPSNLEFEEIASNNTGLDDGDLIVNEEDGTVTVEGAELEVKDPNIDLSGDFLELEFSFLGNSSDLQFQSSSAVRDIEANPVAVDFSGGAVSGDSPAVSLADQGVSVGEEVTVPVETSELREIGSSDITINYNGASLSFERAENVIGTDFSVGSPEAGTVQIDGFSTEGVNPEDNGGRLADLVFTVEEGISNFGDEASLEFAEDSQVSNPTGQIYSTSFDGGQLVVESPQIAATIAPQDTTVESGASVTYTQTVTNEATEAALLDVQITSVPDFLTLEGVEGGTFNASDSTLTLDPEESATVTYSFEESVSSTETFEGAISHETNDPDNATVDLPVSATVEPVQVAVSPQSVGYDTTAIDSTSSQTVTVTNEATETATLEGEALLTEADTPFAIASGGGSFTLGPGESRDVTVDYSPDEVSNPDQDTLVVSDEDGNRAAEVPLAGAAEAAQIAATIAPQDTTVESGASVPFTQTVANEASAAAVLNVQVVSVPDFLNLEESSIEGGGEFDAENLQLALDPGAEATLTYSFQETVSSTQTFDGAISHETNDPNNATVDLPVSATVEAAQIAVTPSELDYGAVPVDGDSTRSFAVENTNGATLAVDSVRTDGPFAVASGADGFDVPGGESQAVEVTYAPEEATEQGSPDEATVRVYHQGDNVASPVEVDLQGAAEAPQFAVSPSDISATVTSGEAEEFAATITNEATQVAALEVQVTSVPDFLTLEGVEGGTFTASDSTVVLDPEQSATVTYSFEESVESTTEFTGTITHETNAPETPTADIPVSVTAEVEEFLVDVSRGFDNATDPSNYELVSLPGAANVDVAETLTGEQGPEWRAFREVGASGDGEADLESYDGSDAFNFQPGRAFWVVSKDDWSFSGTVEAVQEGDGTPSIALQEGWNAISNPLQEDLPWTTVGDANGLDEALWRWDGGWEEADTLASATDGEAYYVFNSAELDSLDLTNTSGTPAVASEEQTDEEASASRTVRLTASPESGDHESSVTVGFDEKATEATTHRAPPAHFGSTALRITENEADATYMRMVAPSSESESVEFDLTLQGEPGNAVTVEAGDLPSAVGADFGVMLVEESSGTTHDLQSGTATVSVPEDGEGTVKLTALLGSEDQLREETAPETLTLKPNYPNPFAEQTTIEYAVPEQTDVTIQVYNVLGQKVATLEQDTKTAGTHRVEWNGDGVSSGTYFVRLKANGTTSTQQVTVVK